MNNIVTSIHKLLLKNKKTLSIAESCTGGLLSSMITDIPGSSACFLMGVVTYSGFSKHKLLKIPFTLIREKGSVSREVAGKMAQSVRRLAKSDFGIGITGIAGPAGATPNKPVGTVFISIANKNKLIVRRFLFKGRRSQIRKQSALKALELLRKLMT